MSTTLDTPSASPSLKTSVKAVPAVPAVGSRLLFAFGTVVAVGAAAYFGLDFLKPGTQASQEFVFFGAMQQDLDITVVERGSLESAKNIDLLCEVEARSPQSAATTILQIVKEGTQVKKGELLVELDSASLKDQITQQQIKVEQAKAALTKAKTDLEITKSQNDSDINTAQIGVDLAEIDLRRYLEGDYLQERRNIDGEIVIAQEELSRAQERLEYSEKLSKKGYVSSSEVESDRLSVIKSQNSLNVAKEKLRVLDEYTKPRQEKDLRSKFDEAKRKLDRVRNESTAKEAQSESAMLAQKLTAETEENTLRKLERQVDKCKIYAPNDGMVVYANDPNSMMRGQPQVQIEEGASVRERQKIIRIPDLSSMLVNVKVHEAKVAHVRSGQPANVRVESMADRIFKGTVKTVATTADAQSFFSSSGVQVYTVMVSIDETVQGLKPGMTAEVEIMADRVPDVLCVPVQAVVERQGQNYCYVRESNDRPPVLRRVELGVSNDKMVVVTSGLEKGQAVVENLSAILSVPSNEENLGRIAKADAEKYGVPKPAEAQVAKKSETGPGPGAAGQPRGNGGPPQGGESAKTDSGGSSGLLAQFDKNQDGKISLADELPEDRRGMFQRYDSNGDGVIDAEELASIRRRGSSSSDGGGGGPGGGMGGFRMPENGADYIKMKDKNGDGKVTQDELSEFEQGFFSRMDANGDGAIDAAEAETAVQGMKERMKSFQSGGGGFGGPPGGQAPQ